MRPTQTRVDRMIILHITYQLEADGPRQLLDVKSSLQSVTERLFQVGQEDDLNSQKPFISNLIWGSIGFAANRTIYKPSVECVIEFENGHVIELPREMIYHIKQHLNS